MVPFAVFVAILCSVSCNAQSESVVPNEATELQEETRGISDDPNVQTDVERNLVAIGGARNEDGTTGSLTVIDYDKNVIGIYDAKTRSCYIIRGQPKSAQPNPAEIQNAPNAAPESGETPTNRVAGGDASVPDRTLLPAPLRDACDGLRLKWMGPGAKASDTGVAVQGDESLGRPPRLWGALIGGVVRAGLKAGAKHAYRRYSNRRCRY